ncbi:hypothetical protein GH714_004442 [Hevea brasiliensis]|uniref:Uncharacterized protein n=1 Tax=Hevea brasiliensis TaxID=3981 RepID=A0A6A6L8W7_HEVBR|nr:hypothetical protein GH714_004442 [Hevea brasiliensis]
MTIGVSSCVRESSLDRDNVEFRENKGLDIDLNVECPPRKTSRESSLNHETVEFTENKGLGIDLNVEFSLQTIASCPPCETAGESSLNRETVEFRENKGLGIDLNVESCPEAEASEVLRATSAVDKVLSNGLESKVGGILAVEKSSSAGDCDAREVGDLLKKKKEVGDHSETDSLTIEAIGKESRSSKVSEAIHREAKDVNNEEKEKEKEKERKQESLNADDGGDKRALPL